MKKLINFYKVKDYPNLKKNMENGLVINIDDESIMNSKKRKEKKREEQLIILSLKDEIQELRFLLNSLIERK